MKFLHTSDWHLGMTFRTHSYKEDQKYVIDQISKIAVKEAVDGILLAGDVFDKGIASQEALQIYDEAMTHICGELKKPIYMIAGNHDGAERISQCSELLKNCGLFIAGSLTRDIKQVNVGDVDIYFLPWISTDKVKSVYPEKAEEIMSMEDAYKTVLDKYRESFTEGHKHILISHSFIVNAETSVSDRAAEVGKATMIGSYVFEGFDYVALGHLHGPQDINDNIRYSGTPMAYSFGKEEKQEKSVTIIDTDNLKEKKIIPIKPLHLRSTLKGNYDDLMRADYDKEVVEGYVRLEVYDRYVGLEAYSLLKEKYPLLLEVNSKDIEKNDVTITMTIDEFEQASNDPMNIFDRYCEDTLEKTPDEHLRNMFKDAVDKYIKEVTVV